jgi:lysophospholipase L1-like esterase
MTKIRKIGLRSRGDILLAVLISTIAASLLIAQCYKLLENTLEMHPQWQSAKLNLEMRLMGAMAFVRSRQPLAGNKLNLGAFFGFQEVTRKRAEDLSELELAFRFETNGYVNILYDIRPSEFSGVRFSNNPDFPSIRFRAASSREFLETELLNIATPLSANVWHHARLSFSATQMNLAVDRDEVGAFGRVGGPQQIGFRGGHRNAWVDDIVLLKSDASLVKESFTNSQGIFIISLFMFAILVGTGIVILIIATVRYEIPIRSIGLGLVTLNASLVVLAAVFYLSQYLFGGSYMAISPAADEDSWRENQVRAMLFQTRLHYGKPADQQTNRILFLGSSQTWGAGAEIPEKTWVNYLERSLNADNRTCHFELVNAGVSGLTSAEVLRLLQDDLLAFDPKLVVINLSSNDLDPDRFRVNLEKIVETLKARDIPVILILEANSTERRPTDSEHGDLSVKHDVIRAIADGDDLVIVDMQDYLTSRQNDGFLWWDFVHLTSFGQKLLAERLYGEIRGKRQECRLESNHD